MKMLSFLLCTLLLTGCVTITTPESRECRYVERDLTQPWAERAYWCEPDTLRTRARTTHSAGTH